MELDTLWDVLLWLLDHLSQLLCWNLALGFGPAGIHGNTSFALTLSVSLLLALYLNQTNADKVMILDPSQMHVLAMCIASSHLFCLSEDLRTCTCVQMQLLTFLYYFLINRIIIIQFSLAPLGLGGGKYWSGRSRAQTAPGVEQRSGGDTCIRMEELRRAVGSCTQRLSLGLVSRELQIFRRLVYRNKSQHHRDSSFQKIVRVNYFFSSYTLSLLCLCLLKTIILFIFYSQVSKELKRYLSAGLPNSLKGLIKLLPRYYRLRHYLMIFFIVTSLYFQLRSTTAVAPRGTRTSVCCCCQNNGLCNVYSQADSIH